MPGESKLTSSGEGQVRKVEYVSYRKRTKDEVAALLKDYNNGMPIHELTRVHNVTEPSFYRILRASKGLDHNSTHTKQMSRIKKLEKDLAAREKEIRLLRAALKKS